MIDYPLYACKPGEDHSLGDFGEFLRYQMVMTERGPATILDPAYTFGSPNSTDKYYCLLNNRLVQIHSSGMTPITLNNTHGLKAEVAYDVNSEEFVKVFRDIDGDIMIELEGEVFYLIGSDLSAVDLLLMDHCCLRNRR